jgi:hypothetical protein
MQWSSALALLSTVEGKSWGEKSTNFSILYRPGPHYPITHSDELNTRMYQHIPIPSE